MRANQSARNGKPGQSKAPVTAHPIFPMVVAVWFAALLGLGSLILPIALIERLVTALGLPSLIAAAAPPIGMTGRLAIAAVATVLGAGLGLLVGRKVATQAPANGRRRAAKSKDTAAPAIKPAYRQPLSAHEELGSDGFDSVASFASARRRALAMEDEARPSDFLQVAPVPGEDDGHGFGVRTRETLGEQYARVDYDQVGANRRTGAVGDPLDLVECPEFAEPEFAEFVDADAAQEITEAGLEAARNAAAPFGKRTQAHDEPAPFANPAPFAPPAHFSQPAPLEEHAPFARAGAAQMTDQQPELAAQADGAGYDGNPTPIEPTPIESDSMVSNAIDAAQPLHFSPPSMARPERAEGLRRDRPANAGATNVAADGREPGLPELLDKLSDTLERHRDWIARQHSAASASPAPAPHFPRALLATDFDFAAPEETAEATASFFAEPAVHDQSEPQQTQALSVGTEEVEPEIAMAATGGVEDFLAVAPIAQAPAPQVIQADEPDAETSETGTVEPIAEPQGRQVFRPFEPGADEAKTAELKPFAGLGRLPVDLAAEDADDHDDEDDGVARLAASFSLPLAAASNQPEAAEPATDAVTPAASLLATKNPFRGARDEFVRVDEPEAEGERAAVIFPHEESPLCAPVRSFDRPADASASFQPVPLHKANPIPSSEEQQRVMREALMNLQRIGKTA